MMARTLPTPPLARTPILTQTRHLQGTKMLILFVVFIVKQGIRPVFHKLQAQVGDVTMRNVNVMYPVVVSYCRSNEYTALEKLF